MRSHICFKRLRFYKCHPPVQSVFYIRVTRKGDHINQLISKAGYFVFECCWCDSVRWRSVELNDDLTKTDEIILNRGEPWKRMGYHNLQKQKYFFEERKIHILFSAILMVPLRGADCGIFCKLKHFFITAKLWRKERNMIHLSWTLRAQRKASPSIASLLWAYWNWCEHHLYQNIWLLIVWHDTMITIDWLMLGIWNSNSSYLNPKMEKTTTPANNEVKQFAMEIVKASRSVFWWIVL